MNATPKQLQWIHAALHSKGLLQHKREMISGYTNNRTESSKEMTYEEASKMLDDLNDQQAEEQKKDKMIRQIIAMAREMGVITRYQVVDGAELKWKSDYTAFNKWLLEKSCVKKDGLNKCSYTELPKLVTQYKTIYTAWLKK